MPGMQNFIETVFSLPVVEIMDSNITSSQPNGDKKRTDGNTDFDYCHCRSEKNMKNQQICKKL